MCGSVGPCGAGGGGRGGFQRPALAGAAVQGAQHGGQGGAQLRLQRVGRVDDEDAAGGQAGVAFTVYLLKLYAIENRAISLLTLFLPLTFNLRSFISSFIIAKVFST